MRVVNGVINSDVLIGIKPPVNSWRQHIADKDEAGTSLDFVDCIVEDISMIDSMQNGYLDVTLVIIDKCDFEIVVAPSRDQNILSVELRYDDRFDESNTKEDRIVGHVEIVVC
jgi:hypothetical protein